MVSGPILSLNGGRNGTRGTGVTNYLRLLGPHVGRVQGRRWSRRPRRAPPGRRRRHARAPSPARRRRDARAEAAPRAHGRRPVARARAARARGGASSGAPPRRPRAPRRRPRRQPPPAARHRPAGPGAAPNSVEHLASAGRAACCHHLHPRIQGRRRSAIRISLPRDPPRGPRAVGEG